ncbi:NYN domain-containing protein [Plantibacter sp. ME-Dv--P-095]|uniref:NYN domain-containing protein n=1 Tax=Plantibacter sp. ME-Dv--P-095 TaxID=3040299 RepID=UPI002549EAF1|nr:NYN domain-containing protein [Plantibacter sp. ME-Dv--P-095]
MAETGTPRVAVYIDFDNIVISRYNQLYGKAAFSRDRARSHVPSTAPEGDEISERLQAARVDVGAILDYTSSFGNIVISRSYADWSEPVNSAYQKDLVDRAVDLTQMFPTTKAMKNGADIRLAVDVVEDLFRLPDLTHIVIVAGDSDYISLAQRCRRLGRHVIGIGVAGATSRALMAACDEFSDYDDLPGIVRPVVSRTPRTPAAVDATASGAKAETSAEETPKAASKSGGRRRASSAAATTPDAPATQAPPRIGGLFTEPVFSHRDADELDDADEETADPSGPDAQRAATELLVRALRLVHAKNDDEDWLLNAEVKNQMIRMDPAFKEKPLGHRSFSDFINSRSDLVEVNPDASPDGRRLRLRELG